MSGDVPLHANPAFQGGGGGGEADEQQGGTYQALRYTSKGEQYLDLGDVGDVLSGAASRAEREELSLLCGQETIEHHFGPGTRLYFSFLQFNILANAVLALTGIISWALFLSSSAGPPPWSFESFFISAYGRGVNDLSWFFCGVASVALWPMFALAYMLWEHFVYEPAHPRPVPKEADTRDDIVENIDLPRVNTTGRRVFVFVLMGLICCAAVAGLYGLLQVQNYLVETYGGVQIPFASVGLLFSFAISLCVVVFNLLWNKISYHLTRFERHRTWGYFAYSHAVKLIVMKLFVATGLYVLIATVLREGPASPCLYFDSGKQFLSFLIIDITVSNLLQIFGPIIMRKLRQCLGSKLSDEELRPEFDLSEQFLSVLYRQFILYLGVLVFPLMGVLGVIGNLIEYPIDRLHLLRLSKDPHFILDTHATFLMIFLLLVGLFAFLVYPNGALWILFLPRFLPAGFQNCSMTGAITRL